MAEQSRLFAWREAVRDSRSLSSNARLVALVLSLRMKSTTGDCAVGNARLALETDLSVSSVRRAVAELEAGWLTVTRDERPGRGNVNGYTLTPRRGPEESPSHRTPSDRRSSQEDTDPATTAEKGVTVTSELVPPVQPMNEKVKRSRRSTPKTYPSSIEALCSRLAERIGEQTGHAPKITDAWRHDMDLLARRGPASWADPEPIDPERIEKAIDHVFTTLAAPKRNGFCWANVVRSPDALRRQWDQLRGDVKTALRTAPGAGQTFDESLDEMAVILNGHHHPDLPALTGGTR